MKKTIYLTILLFSTNIYTSCNQTTLTNEEAKALIKKDLGVPVSFHQDLTKQATIFSADILNVLRTEGLVNGPRYVDVNTPIQIEITEKGQSSFVSEEDSYYRFKTNDIDFDQITGISVNKEDQTATVRFTLKATNVTPAAIALSKQTIGYSGNKYIPYNLETPINGELVYKKFDNGWQLQNQDKAGSQLLDFILKGGR